MGSLHPRNPSYWVGTAAETSFFPYRPDDQTFDVAVVGGGIAGLTTAVLLKETGARVALVEADRVASGVTGYTTAKLTALHGLVYATVARTFGDEAAATYAEANQEAIATVSRLVGDLAIDCALERLPAFTYTEDVGRVADVEAEVEAARRAGLPAAFTVDTGLPYPVRGAIRVEDQAQFHPRRYCIGLAEALDGDGCAVFEQTRVLDVDDPGTGPCLVKTEHGELRVDRVVLATHLPIVDAGGFFAKTHPVRSYALTARLDAPAPAGMYLSADQPTRSVRPVTALSSEAVLGGESHKVGQHDDTRQCYQAVETWARERFGVEEISFRWSAQDYVPVDGLPYIGRLSARSARLFVATGFKKWGMTLGTAGAVILRDLVTGGDNRWAGLFDARRLRPATSAPSLLKENLNVAKRFLGDRISAVRSPGLDEVAVGEGRICVVDGERVAVHRDEAGAVHAVSPVCTHLGCLVAWNTAERTWDCPCHGSRYDFDGRVIQGPAVKDLDTKQPGGRSAGDGPA